MYLTIFNSIEKCHLLYFYYEDYSRIVEPHIFGIDRRGRDAVYGYQVAGADALGRHPGWKCYLIDGMHRVQTLDAHFVGPRAGFNPHQRTWQRIYVQMPGCKPARRAELLRV